MSRVQLDKLYECMYILDPSVPDEQLPQMMERVGSIVTDAGGTVDVHKPLGRRRLAYEINDKREGTYLILYFKGAQAVNELNREMQMGEQYLRHLIVIANEQAIWGKEPPSPPAPPAPEAVAGAAVTVEPAPEEAATEDQRAEPAAEEGEAIEETADEAESVEDAGDF